VIIVGEFGRKFNRRRRRMKMTHQVYEAVPEGLSREAELENLLGEVLDLHLHDEIFEEDSDGTGYTEVFVDLTDRIGVALDEPQYEIELD